MDAIEDGNRLPPPPGCPKAMYKVMMKCWFVKSNTNNDDNVSVISHACMKDFSFLIDYVVKYLFSIHLIMPNQKKRICQSKP